MCICGRMYTPLLEDVGHYLAFYWLPTRSDGKCGNPLVAICDSPVEPGMMKYPIFSCTVKVNSVESLILSEVRTYSGTVLSS